MLALLKLAAPLAVVAIFVASLLYLYSIISGFFPETGESAQPPISPPPHAECSAGDKAECTSSQGCPGTRMCREGKWSECMVKKICSPGEEQGCFIGTCATGKQVCNACGTAYENCTQT